MTHWINSIDPHGENCPTCTRWAKMNKFKITKANARTLIWMHRNTNNDDPWIDMVAVRKIVPMSNFQNLKHWNLIARLTPNVKTSTKYSGVWMVTPSGHEFVKGLLSVPKYMYVFDDTVHGTDTPDVTIHDCIEKFDYDEHMGLI